jgi:trehalose/maltose hydrolase-like predicted phosphorylase
MGQRANFEENYSGATFQGSYIAGIYYPDKTKSRMVEMVTLNILLRF